MTCRPCRCDRFQPGEYRTGDCRSCWLYRHDDRYRKLWGNCGFGWGDLVALVARWTGLALVVGLFTRTTGVPCGCETRREFLNRLPTPWRSRNV